MLLFILLPIDINVQEMQARDMFKEIISEIRPGLKVYLIWVISGLINVIALILWAMFQFALSRIISRLGLIGMDVYVFLMLQILSAISTLIPIALFIYRDSKRMWQLTVAHSHESISSGASRIEQRQKQEEIDYETVA